jgi:hypothetical protein
VRVKDKSYDMSVGVMEDYKLKIKEFTRLTYTDWVAREPGTPKDRDEVNKREDCECIK